MTTEPQSRYRLPAPLHRWVNEDGERHPLENTLALLTVSLGVISVVCLLPGAWQVAAWTGLAGALVAAYDEFIAKTSGERRLILVGFVLCLVSVAVGSAHGTFF